MRPQNIRIKTQSNEIYFSIETAVPLGLIINEIITNSLKHGFKNIESGGIINIKLSAKEEEYTLLIGDNGIGFTEKRKFKSLGLKLIKKLSIQLNATIERDDARAGTLYKITFSDR